MAPAFSLGPSPSVPWPVLSELPPRQTEGLREKLQPQAPATPTTHTALPSDFSASQADGASRGADGVSLTSLTPDSRGFAKCPWDICQNALQLAHFQAPSGHPQTLRSFRPLSSGRGSVGSQNQPATPRDREEEGKRSPQGRALGQWQARTPGSTLPSCSSNQTLPGRGLLWVGTGRLQGGLFIWLEGV